MAYNPLEKLCLAAVANNFAVYMAAYESDNRNISLLLEFLQRRYASVLLYMMLPKGKLSHVSYKFLICDHLKVLNLSEFPLGEAPFLIERLSEVGKNIRILNLKDSKYLYSNVDIKKIVEHTPNVEELNLSYTNADDDVMKAIGCNKTLHDLDITACDISSAALEYLCKKDDNGGLLPNFTLKRLCLSGAEEKVAFALMNFSSLEVLKAYWLGKVLWDIYEERYRKGLLDVSPKFNLTAISEMSSFYYSETEDICMYTMEDILEKYAFLCPKTTSLKLSNFDDPMAAQACTKFADLQNILLYSEGVNIDFSPILKAFSASLKQICFTAGFLSTDLLLKCHQLQKLELSRIQLQPITGSISERNEPALENLTSLTFDYMDFNEQMETTMLLIRSCPNLKRLLFLSCRGLYRELAECLCNCKCIAKLVKLVLRSPYINFYDILMILKHAKCLKKLDINDCDISYTQYKDILSFIKVNGRKIDVSNCTHKPYTHQDDSLMYSSDDIDYLSDYYSESSYWSSF